MKKTFYTFISFLALGLLAACGNSGANVSGTDIVGTWECVGGKLNGDPDVPFAQTETAPGALVKFSETVMEFELLEIDLGKSKTQPYKLEGSKLSFSNDPNLQMNIKNIEGQKMTLEMRIGENILEMEMERK